MSIFYVTLKRSRASMVMNKCFALCTAFGNCHYKHTLVEFSKNGRTIEFHTDYTRK